jgi:2-phospho-L-lactate guanylyltransferase
MAEGIWAVVPVKETALAKQRLAGMLPAVARQQLALAMLEDVLDALAAVRELAGIAVVTVDAAAAEIAARCGAEVWTQGAREGHTGAVAAAAARLGRQGLGMLTIPADVPLVQPVDIQALLHAHRGVPRFTIVPARDRRGSNAIVCVPADAVPLQFGDDSFRPHLAAAQDCGLAPLTMHLPRIALDVDRPDDVAELLRQSAPSRAVAVLLRYGIAEALEAGR